MSKMTCSINWKFVALFYTAGAPYQVHFSSFFLIFLFFAKELQQLIKI